MPDSVKTEDYRFLHIKLMSLRKTYEEVRNDIQTTQNALEQVCPHPEHSITNKYIEGGYLDRSEYLTLVNCRICGKELNRKSELGGYS